jgi:hypothetical protein
MVKVKTLEIMLHLVQVFVPEAPVMGEVRAWQSVLMDGVGHQCVEVETSNFLQCKLPQMLVLEAKLKGMISKDEAAQLAITGIHPGTLRVIGEINQHKVNNKNSRVKWAISNNSNSKVTSSLVTAIVVRSTNRSTPLAISSMVGNLRLYNYHKAEWLFYPRCSQVNN